MKVFVSYSSARRPVAERLKLALEAEGHDVFFDRDDLPAGETFHRAIRTAIDEADLCVFLVSPESVVPGSYTLAELGQVQQRWPRPAGRVLPVLLAPTPRQDIPPYLLAVTLLEPRGEPVAETVARVAALARPPVWRRPGPALAAALLLVALAWVGWQQWDQRRAAAAAREAQVRQQTAAAGRALDLCRQGSPAEGFDLLGRLAGAPEGPSAARTALEDCAMDWLRQARVTEGHTSFEQLVAPLKPVLAQALVAGAAGARAGDLHAHLGWADALVRRDGRSVTPDPEASYRRALAADAGNPYAHAMWAHWLLLQGGSGRNAALQHFDAALAGGRDTAFVRRLQLGAMVGKDALRPDLLQVLNQMRQRGEAVDPSHKRRLWSHLYAFAYRPADAALLTQALPAADALATFRWLFARGEPDPSLSDLWRLIDGLLLTRAGRADEARPDLEALVRELRARRASGPLVDAAAALVATR